MKFNQCPDCGAILVRAAVEQDRQCWHDQQRRQRYVPNEQRAIFWHIFNLASLANITRTVDAVEFERMKRTRYVTGIYPSMPAVRKPTRKKKPKSWEIGTPPPLASILRSQLHELRRRVQRMQHASERAKKDAWTLPGQQRQHRDGLQAPLSVIDLRNKGFMKFDWDEKARKRWWKHANAANGCICRFGHLHGRKTVNGLPEEIVRLRALGLTYAKIAHQLGKLESEIRLLVRRASRKNSEGTSLSRDSGGSQMGDTGDTEFPGNRAL